MFDKEVLARLRHALRDPDPARRAECVDALAAGRDARGLRIALRSPDAYLRWRALRTLGTLPDGTPTWRLVRAAIDPAPTVREVAASSLGIGRSRLAAWALRRLSTDDVPAVRLAALRSLAQLNFRPARARLAAASRTDPDPSLREAAAALLQQLEARARRSRRIAQTEEL